MPRLVAIGDSLTQGVQSGAIFRTELSFPALIADAMDLRVPDDFRVPRFPGSGLPINIEWVLRALRRQLGSDIRTFEWALLLVYLGTLLDDIEDLYERGAGSRPAVYRGIYHNLAVAGFRVFDSFNVHADYCHQQITREEGWIQDDFMGLPSAPMYRIAQRVLNPARRADRAQWTQVDNLSALNTEDPVENLILFLGANDCLKTVTDLRVRDMPDDDDPPSDAQQRRQAYNLTSTQVFEADYRELVQRISCAIGKDTRVFVGTVPHVTIPPITRGILHKEDFVGKDESSEDFVEEGESSYFPYYGRFFATEESFNPHWDPYLTGQDAQFIDSRIDAFNCIIQDIVSDKKGWHIVDICGLLDRLAIRRNSSAIGQRGEGTPELERTVLRDFFAEQDHPLLALEPTPSVLRFESRNNLRRRGGFFSLDCFHPTTIGYGLIAEAFLRKMRCVGVQYADPERLNWRQIIRQDTLVHTPPVLWDDILEAAEAPPRLSHLIYRIFS